MCLGRICPVQPGIVYLCEHVQSLPASQRMFEFAGGGPWLINLKLKCWEELASLTSGS